MHVHTHNEIMTACRYLNSPESLQPMPKIGANFGGGSAAARRLRALKSPFAKASVNHVGAGGELSPYTKEKAVCRVHMGQEYDKRSSRSISIHSESMKYTKTVSDGPRWWDGAKASGTVYKSLHCAWKDRGIPTEI